MKFKHNKKRNTAFVFESLVREMVKSVISEDAKKKETILSTLKKFFNKNTVLYRELQIYNSILEAREMEKDMKEKLIKEARLQHQQINKKEIFTAHSALIKEINTKVTKKIFNNFVPNYKNLATIYNLLNMDMSPKRKVILENKLIEELQHTEAEKKLPSDNLTFQIFIKQYNEKYGNNLLQEQKKLLNTYIVSFADNGIEMKLFLNEELGRIKNKLSTSLNSSLAVENKEIKEKLNQTIQLVESFAQTPLTPKIITNVLKIQGLLNEMNAHD